MRYQDFWFLCWDLEGYVPNVNHSCNCVSSFCTGASKRILLNSSIIFSRPSMSQGTVMVQPKQDKDFTVGTPEEFVRRFGGTKVINKVKGCVHAVHNLDHFGKDLKNMCIWMLNFSGFNCQQWDCCCQVHAFYSPLVLWDVQKWEGCSVCGHGHPRGFERYLHLFHCIKVCHKVSAKFLYFFLKLAPLLIAYAMGRTSLFLKWHI